MIKTLKRHRQTIFSALLLLLVLVYTTPLTALHNCSNLNHKQKALHFEESHGHCFICDIVLHAYDNSESIRPVSNRFSVILKEQFISSEPANDSPSLLKSRAPPASV